MIILAIFASIAAIGLLCWLLFTLAVYALPLFAGVSAAAWAYETGAGVPGAAIVGLVAGAMTLGLGQSMLVIARPVWLKLAIAAAFAAPAAIAGYHAAHGIVKHLIPSDIWQIIMSIVAALLVGGTALVRVAAMGSAVPPPAGHGLARS